MDQTMEPSEVFEKLSTSLPYRVRAGEIRSGAKGARSAVVVPYLDRVQVLRRLDQVLGNRWQSDYSVVDERKLLVRFGIGIRFVDGWAWRWDVGGPQDLPEDPGALTFEAKCAVSDGLKRAAALWGVGRFIADLPRGVRCPCVTQGKGKTLRFVRWDADPFAVLESAIETADGRAARHPQTPPPFALPVAARSVLPVEPEDEPQLVAPVPSGPINDDDMELLAELLRVSSLPMAAAVAFASSELGGAPRSLPRSQFMQLLVAIRDGRVGRI